MICAVAGLVALAAGDAIAADASAPDRRREVEVAQLYPNAEFLSEAMGIRVVTRDAPTSSERRFAFADGEKIRIMIDEMPTVASASRVFRRSNPRRYFEAHFGDSRLVTNGAGPLSADGYVQFCGMVHRADCAIWVYWAQYGQYLVQIESVNMKDSVPQLMADLLVQAVDRSVFTAVG